MSTDFYLPALPALTEALATDIAHAQLTLSVFLLGFAVGQLFYGPLSDRHGRRPMLLIGLSVYAVATVGCLIAPDIETLIAARFVQALGACAGPVLGRAIVRDVYGPRDAARMLAYVSAAMAVAPLVGPLLGGALTVWFDWRATFAFLLTASTLQLLAVARLLGETVTQPDPAAARPRRILANYLDLLGDRRYRAVLLCNGLAYSGLFAFISGSPFVFIQLFGFSPQQMGLAFGIVVSGYIAGSLLSGRLSARFGPQRLLGWGCRLGALAGCVLALIGWAGLATPLGVIVPVWCSLFAVGWIMPNAAAIGLAPYPRMAGSASSLMGFSQMLLAALFGAAVGHSLDHSVMPMALAICLANLLCWGVCARWLRAHDDA